MTQDFERLIELERIRYIAIGLERNQANNFWHRTAGNGSIMQLAPVPMVFRKNMKQVEVLGGRSSRTTHQAPEAIDACRLFSLMIAKALNGSSKKEILSSDYQLSKPLSPKIDEILQGNYKTHEPDNAKNFGYVVNTLTSALYAFYSSKTFKEGALLAINLRGDTDTTGAVYGQLAGAFYGYDAIPEEWREIIPLKDHIVNAAEDLYELSKTLTTQSR